jgi:hypothetical protein
MNTSETPTIEQVEELLAENGYEVSEAGAGLLRVKDMETGVSFQVAMEGNVLYMSVTLTTVPQQNITSELMREMLDSEAAPATSAFKLVAADGGKIAITLNNFCTLQNMGPEDKDDVLSLASYLMADLLQARDLLEPAGTGTARR